MLKPPSNTKAPKIQRLSVEDWTNGVVTAFDDGRSPLRGLRSSENMILDQDSVITVRHGTAKYGPQPHWIVYWDHIAWTCQQWGT